MKIGNKSITIKKKGEFIIPAVATMFALLYLKESMRLFSSDAMLLTRMVLIGVIALSVVVMLKQFNVEASEKMEGKENTSTIPFWKNDMMVKTLVFIVLTGLSLALLNTLGYIVTFGGYLIIMMYILGIRQPKILVFVPTGILLFIYFLFQKWLMVPLPRGILG